MLPFGALGFFALFWAVTCCKPTSGQPDGPQMLFQGRFSPGEVNGTTTLPQIISWPGSSVFTAFEGTEFVRVNITALPQNGSVSYGINWIRFYVDDQFAADGYTSYNQLQLIVTLNVTRDVHTLRIAKLIEGSKGEAVINRIDIGSAGRFLEPEPPAALASGKRILFFGDSYSVGFGDTGGGSPSACRPTVSQIQEDWLDTCKAVKVNAPDECAAYWTTLNQNNLQAFPAIASDALEADFQLLGGSGAGMVGYSYAAAKFPQLSPWEYQAVLPTNEAMLNRSVYADSALLWDSPDWVPQVIVIASGTNDWHSASLLYNLDQWLVMAIAFLKKVSFMFERPTIILQSWPGDQQAGGPQVSNSSSFLDETQQYLLALDTLFNEAVKQGVPNIYYMNFTNEDYDVSPNWCGGHPSAKAHRVIAQQLVDYIGDLLPGWNSTVPVNMTVDQVAIRPNTSLYASSLQPGIGLAG